ncbi:hypothetical protein [Geminocystis sp. NIES-3709]|uniref:hypothetical protein n=1 Tax=Geminocystis sp. NIES-3709 TaxID=1617448 RepID=UPI001E42304B|nr:hypothetical protein [Geminocystis sp. NIES-3709]
MFPLNDLTIIGEVLGRKEFFFFLGISINLFFISKVVKNLHFSSIDENSQESRKLIINKYCYDIFFCYNLLSIPTALSHEAIIFLGVPLNMIITATLIGFNYSKKIVLIKTFLIYLPTIFVSCLGLIFKGNEQVALDICRSWEEYNLASDCINKLPLVLSFYNVSTIYIIKDIIRVNVLENNGTRCLSWIFTFLLNGIILMRTSENIINKSVENINQKIEIKDNQNLLSKNISINFSFKYIFIPFLCSFILYIIAYDWGRWFFITVISYALCLLTPSLIKLEMYSYQNNKWILNLFSPIYNIYSKLMSYFQTNFSIQKHFRIYSILLIYTLIFMRITYYGMTAKDLLRGLIPNFIYRFLKDIILS